MEVLLVAHCTGILVARMYVSFVIHINLFYFLESGEYAGLVFNAFDLNRRGKLSYEVHVAKHLKSL